MTRNAWSPAVEHYRTIGCLIVIDDFGAGYSNFDRIWRLKPDIVKIDREMTRRVTVEPARAAHVRRDHLGAARVGCARMRGRNRDRRRGALRDRRGRRPDAGQLLRLAGGAAPARACLRRSVCAALQEFPPRDAEFYDQRRERLQPYVSALANAVLALSAGADRASAVRALLNLDCTERCYLVAGDGSQIGASAETELSAAARDQRLTPIRPVTGTNWQTKPFFRRAIEAPGKVQITRPYLSATGPKFCVTLSYAFP